MDVKLQHTIAPRIAIDRNPIDTVLHEENVICGNLHNQGWAWIVQPL